MDSPHEQSDLVRPRTTEDSGTSVEQLRNQCQQLQSLFVVALAALLLLGMVCCLFIFKQWRMVRAQVNEQRPAVQRMVAEYQNGSEKLIRNFAGSLQNFAAQHPDFRPILERYREPLRSYLVPSVPAPPSSTAPNKR